MSTRLARIIDCYGKTPETDMASYVLLEDDKPTAWYTEAEVTDAVLKARYPAKHWQVHTTDGLIHDFADAAECQLGQYGAAELYRLSNTDGDLVAEFPREWVNYVRQV